MEADQHPRMDRPAEFQVEDLADGRAAVLAGDWTALTLGEAAEALRRALDGAPATRLDLTAVRRFDTAGAFALVAFVVGHIYLTTTGHSLFSNLKAMITGYEEIGEEPQPDAPAVGAQAEVQS